jgi:hypothetical protein
LPDASDSGSDLIGVSPRLIAEIMGIITLIVPFGIIPTSVTMINIGLVFEQPIIYGLLWVYTPISVIHYSVYNFYFTWITIPFSILNVLYFRHVVRYYQGKTSRYNATWMGVFSITLPTIFSLATTGIFNPFLIFGFIGPIPIQFIAGLIIMHRIPGPMLPSPFSSEMQVLDMNIPDRVQVLSELFSDHDDVGPYDQENGTS